MLVDSKKLSSGRALSEAEKMQRERQRIGDLKGIVSYSWAADSKTVLVPLDGELLLAGLDGTVRKVGRPGRPAEPAPGPKGGSVSFVRDRRLWVVPVAGGPARRSRPPRPQTVHWGEAEFVAQEELARMSGFWWSPDEAPVAVERSTRPGWAW
jgi:dipeptidyl-peptidase-4